MIQPRPTRRLVREAASSIGCPPDFMGVPALVILASAIGNSRVFRLKGGWEEGATIYAASVASPGTKKTPAYKEALRPATNVQAKLYRVYQHELRRYEEEPREGSHQAKPPALQRAWVKDITVEALTLVLGFNKRGLLVVRDELSGWVRSMNQYKGGKGADRQFYLEAWGNSSYAVDRKGTQEPIILVRPFICLYGMPLIVSVWYKARIPHTPKTKGGHVTPGSTIVVAWDIGRSSVRSLRIGPLLVAIAICVLFALFGTALIGESLGNWYDTLEKPWFLIPLWAFGIVGAVYYVLFATVLYRIFVHVDDRRGRATSLALTISVMFFNELWNYGFFGLESTLVGFWGIAVFLIPVTALLLTLRTYERFSAGLVAVYWIWVLYDLAWTFALWKLNS